jgi:hypothetical protein
MRVSQTPSPGVPVTMVLLMALLCNPSHVGLHTWRARGDGTPIASRFIKAGPGKWLIGTELDGY